LPLAPAEPAPRTSLSDTSLAEASLWEASATLADLPNHAEGAPGAAARAVPDRVLGQVSDTQAGQSANGEARSPSSSSSAHPTRDRPSHEEIHGELCRRLALLQSEQLTRWQKILSLLPGQLAGKPTLY